MIQKPQLLPLREDYNKSNMLCKLLIRLDLQSVRFSFIQ